MAAPRSVLVAASLVALLHGAESRAQEGGSRDDASWTLRFTPYVWLPAQEGDVAVHGRFADVDVSVGDTIDALDHLQLATAFHLEAEKDELSLLLDVNYQRSEDERGSAPKSEVEFTREFYEAGASWTLFDEQLKPGRPNRLRFDALGGIRVHEVEQELEAPGVDASSSELWVDAFVGGRFRYELGERLYVWARGDWGFGQSDAAWNAVGGVEMRLTKGLALHGGYRWYSVDYDAHGTNRKFLYDLLLQGPFLGLTFVF
jgi:hypothetical protein